MRLGAVIPNFSADTTEGPIQFYDWQGDSYVILFSHPADFTPVCTTELAEFVHHTDDFVKRNVKLIGHSVDSVESHLEWIKDINSYCSNLPTDFPFPIIADKERDLAIELGMLDEDQRHDMQAAITIRVLYIVGPDHKVRLSMLYPNGTGRSVEEILRCLDSIQLTDRIKNVATPASWTPGTDVMILPTVPDDDIRRLFPRQEITYRRVPSGRRYLRYFSNFN